MKVKVFRRIDKDMQFHYYLDSFGKDVTYNLEHIEDIDRKIFHKGFVGNFVPHYCRYKNKVHSVHGSIDHAYMHGYNYDAYIVIE
jgi:hypothetical protein